MPTLRLAAWHRGKVASVIKEFLAAGAAKRLHLERLPGYAPELNPQEICAAKVSLTCVVL